MKELLIDPNAPRGAHSEIAWLDRDLAAIHHFDDGADTSAPPPVAAVQPQPAVPETSAHRPDGNAAVRPATPAIAAAPPPAAAAPAGQPLLAALLATLPAPQAAWSGAERADWLRAAEAIFHVVYKTEGRVRIESEAA